MKISRETKFGLFWLSIIVAMILIGLSACSKKEEKPTYSVTYEFYSKHTPYFIQIWDVTNLNDFKDSVYANSFTKTITYDYNSTHNSGIYSKIVSKKKMSITWGSRVAVREDSLYPSLECSIPQ